MFLRKTKAREPVQLTMTGVRMGERLLQIGIDDPAMAGALAAKVGLSGTAAVAVTDDMTAARANSAAAGAGALVDVTVTPLDNLPYDDGAFDVIVVHGIGLPVGVSPGVTAEALRQCQRVLRPGGRIVVIAEGAKSGLGGLFRSAPAEASIDSAVPALTAAGFRPVRVVGELEGFRFIEGLRS